MTLILEGCIPVTYLALLAQVKSIDQSIHPSCMCRAWLLSAINGIGLSLVIPNAQSITADYYDELDRGKAFGALYMTSALGGAIGSLYATNQGKQAYILAPEEDHPPHNMRG